MCGFARKNFVGTALDRDAQQFRPLEVLARLRGHQHARVLLPPRLERLGHVGANRGVAQEPPRLVQHEHFERAGERRVEDRRRRPMEEVEQQRLQDQRHAVEALEVDVLKRRQRDGVLDVIEDAARTGRPRTQRCRCCASARGRMFARVNSRRWSGSSA